MFTIRRGKLLPVRWLLSIDSFMISHTPPYESHKKSPGDTCLNLCVCSLLKQYIQRQKKHISILLVGFKVVCVYAWFGFINLSRCEIGHTFTSLTSPPTFSHKYCRFRHAPEQLFLCQYFYLLHQSFDLRM